MIDCSDIYPPGGEYVELEEVAVNLLQDPHHGARAVPVCEGIMETKSYLDGKENLSQKRTTFQASLYRNKIRKVNMNPLQPLRNPYRVSEHDQMPIRVIPLSPTKENVAPSYGLYEVTSNSFSNKKSSSGTFFSKRKKATKNAEPGALLSNGTCSTTHPSEFFDTKTCEWNAQDLPLTPCHRASSIDDLLMPSKQRGCMTRNAMKRAKEQYAYFTTSRAPYMTRNSLKCEQKGKTLKLDGSNLSLSSNEGSVKQLSRTLTRSNHRSSKCHKSRQKFNFGFFSRNSKCKSEYALNEQSIFGTSLDFPEKAKKDEITGESCGREMERSFTKKRRLSSIRSKLNMTFGARDPLPVDHSAQLESRAPLKKVKKRAISKLKCENSDMERNCTLSLRFVLENRELREEFHRFLIREHSEENLDFWMMCEKFKTSNDRINLAAIIHRQFLKQHAPREVNLSAKAKHSIEQDCHNLTETSFVVAQDSIFQLMEDDSFRRFCRQRS